MVNINSYRWRTLRVLYYAERPLNSREITSELYPLDHPDFMKKLKIVSSLLCRMQREGIVKSVGRFMNHSHIWQLSESKRDYIGRKLASNSQSQSQQTDNHRSEREGNSHG